MAREIQVRLIDDLDQSSADRTVPFSFDGANYEIDLSVKNIDQLSSALSSFIDAGRKVSGPRRNATKPAGNADRERNNAIREWARKSGQAVSDRGRISAQIVSAYNAAH